METPVSRKDQKKIKEAFAILKKRGIPCTIANAIPFYDELVAKEQAIGNIGNRLQVAEQTGLQFYITTDEVKLLLSEIKRLKG